MPSARWLTRAAGPSRATVGHRRRAAPGHVRPRAVVVRQDKVLVAPEAALSPSGKRSTFGRVKDGKRERRVGESAAKAAVEILTGVAAGDQLVVAGMRDLTAPP